MEHRYQVLDRLELTLPVRLHDPFLPFLHHLIYSVRFRQSLVLYNELCQRPVSLQSIHCVS